MNAFALRVREHFTGEWLTVRFDNLFAPETATQLLSFVGCGAPDEAIRPGLVDEEHFVTRDDVKPFEIANHAEVLRVARLLGFDPLAIDVQSLENRYKARVLARS